MAFTMNKRSGIYQIKSRSNISRCYIGSAINIDHRWECHISDLNLNKHGSKKLQRHFNKYGITDLEFIVVEPCFPEFLTIREQFYLDSIKPYFNSRPKAESNLGCKFSKEACLKMSKGQMGSKNRVGKKSSDESKEKNRLAHLGEKNPNFGKHHSEETKQKIREADLRNGNTPPSQLGRKRSEETKRKLKGIWELEKIK